ncbi:MAG TPA: YkgJ family cysteine cluster protein [Verrucomicrobiae bacterium]
MEKLTDTLCLQCGMCCNGVLFADVRRERIDPSPLFEQHGSRVAQPCPAFNFGTCACAIYAGRPARCRTFECRQLLGVRNGTIPTKNALRQIRAARKLVSKIEKLLGQLGFNDAKLPLKSRFEKCRNAVESEKIPAADLGILARLQLAFHRLNLLLAEKFL